MNQQYSETDYYTMRDKLIDHMKQTGEWGEFFSHALAPFGYNETMANEFFPLGKDQALANGWQWQDQLPGTYGKESMAMTALVDNIAECTEQVLKEVLACVNCKRNYKIVKAEFDFYKQQSIPIPDQCPDCRHWVRTRYRSPYQLIERQCMCENTSHRHDSANKGTTVCPTKFQTAYPTSAPEILYCEDCYRAEIY